jgi:hypothetical protein
MRRFFAWLRLKLAAHQFAPHRDDWYDYLADIMADSAGQQTLLRIFVKREVNLSHLAPFYALEF